MKRSEVARILRDSGCDNATGEAKMIFDALQTFSPPFETNPDSDSLGIDATRLADILRRRCAKEPLQYLLGYAYFCHECYEVSPDCLIPRSDTERLVEYAAAHLPQNAYFADLCTGSGCVAISVLALRPDCRAIAVELSEAALSLARRNAEKNGVGDRVSFSCTDALTFVPKQRFDAVLSNPPYIPSDVILSLSAEVQAEPKMALDGGSDGLVFYRAFCEKIPLYIYKEGFCAFEIGFDQANALCELAKKHNCSSEVLSDYGGNDRVCVLRPL